MMVIHNHIYRVFIQLFSLMLAFPVISAHASSGLSAHASPGLSAGQAKLGGLIVDEQSGDVLEFANVSLMLPADSSLVTGTTADFDGRFELEAEAGSYILRIGFVGYEDKWMPVDLEPGQTDLGTLALTSLSEQLGEVTVEAAAALFRTEFDRRVFSLENTVVAEGGTALQALETLPSIQIDEEGSITMRGSGSVEIYINGRPTNLSSDDAESILESFPADAIESVELITNPSARYEAEGVGGIINLILKESRLQGFNGQLTSSAGTGNKYTGGLNLNYRGSRFNMFTSYSYQYRELWEENLSSRNYFSDNVSPYLTQDYYTENFRNGHLIRTGFEYELSAESSVRLHSNINYRSRDRERTYNIRSKNVQMELDSMFVRFLDEDQSRLNYEFGVNYGWRPDENNGQRLDAAFSIAIDEQDRIEYFDQEFFNAAGMPVAEKRALQTYERPAYSRLMVAELDYRMPINENLSFEAGLRSNIRRHDLEQIFEEYDFTQNQFLVDELITNQFRYDRDIHAAYLIMQNRLGSFSYQAGLRGELTLSDSYEPANGNTIRNRYFDLFPSIFLNYEISENQDVQVNYSRRVRRPGTRALMPFINAQDFFNLRIGNPYLDPAYTNSYEISYLRGWENYFLSGSLYHRHTANAISRIFELFDDRYAIVTWINSNTRRNTGLELVNQLTFSQNADVTLTGNLFHSEISGVNNEGVDFVNENFSWTISMLGNFRIPNWFNLQVMGNYRGPIAVPQGYIKPMYGLSLGLRRNVMQQSGTISLSVSDVLNSRRFVLETNGSSFGQQRQFSRESRVITLSFTYRFGGYRDNQSSRPSDGFNGGEDGLY